MCSSWSSKNAPRDNSCWPAMIPFLWQVLLLQRITLFSKTPSSKPYWPRGPHGPACFPWCWWVVSVQRFCLLPVCFLGGSIASPSVMRQAFQAEDLGWGHLPGCTSQAWDNHLVPLGWRRLKSFVWCLQLASPLLHSRNFQDVWSMMEISPQPPIALIGICGPFCKLFRKLLPSQNILIRKKRKRKTHPAHNPAPRF